MNDVEIVPFFHTTINCEYIRRKTHTHTRKKNNTFPIHSIAIYRVAELSMWKMFECAQPEKKCQDIKNTNDMALKWASKAHENDRTISRDCWIFYHHVGALVTLTLKQSARIQITMNFPKQKKERGKNFPILRPYALKYAFSIVWNCLNWNRWLVFFLLFPVVASTGTPNQNETYDASIEREEEKNGKKNKKIEWKNEIINLSIYWQMTKKGFRGTYKWHYYENRS